MRMILFMNSDVSFVNFLYIKRELAVDIQRKKDDNKTNAEYGRGGLLRHRTGLCAGEEHSHECSG